MDYLEFLIIVFISEIFLHSNKLFQTHNTNIVIRFSALKTIFQLINKKIFSIQQFDQEFKSNKTNGFDNLSNYEIISGSDQSIGMEINYLDNQWFDNIYDKYYKYSNLQNLKQFKNKQKCIWNKCDGDADCPQCT